MSKFTKPIFAQLVKLDPVFHYLSKRLQLVYILLVILISSFLYFPNYDYPNKSIWDEVYFVPMAHKYISGTYFMQEHPPLGKLFIALGEKIFNDNPDAPGEFYTVKDNVKQIPANYSYRGVRFFPVIFGILASAAFFYLLYLLLGNPHLAFLFSFLYIFDNSLIADGRAALLQSTQIFFMLLALAYFVKLVNKTVKIKIYEYFLLGVLVSLPILVKVNAAVFILLPIFVYFKENGLNLEDFVKNVNNLKFLKRGLAKAASFLGGVLLMFIIIFSIHGAIARNYVPDKQDLYSAKDDYKAYLLKQESFNPLVYGEMLWQNFIYGPEVHGKVHPLDFAHFVNIRSASYPISWPIGSRAIMYSYLRENDTTRYVYLQGNPINWAVGLMAVILSLVLVLGKYLFGLKIKNPAAFQKIQYFLILYLAYMFQMMNITRILYLYHYLIPLVLSFILAGLLFQYAFEEDIKIERIATFLYGLITVVCIISIGVFLFFSPLTYFQPLNEQQMSMRRWINFWDLEDSVQKLDHPVSTNSSSK